MTSALPSRPSFRSQWKSFLDQVCTTRLSQARLREILDVLLYDGEDIRQCNIFGVSSSDDPSPVLSPVERLLLFVRIALGRLQGDLSLARLDPTFRTTQPQHFWYHRNLKRLVNLALSSTTPRAFSRIDRLRLYAQWSSLSYLSSQLHHHERVRQAGHASSRFQLTRLEEQIEALPQDVEVQSIRALCLYRRAVHAIRTRPARFDEAASYLRELLMLPARAVPPGLYLHCARRLYRLPFQFRRKILHESRQLLANAFALIPPSRSFDRIGLAYLLAQDALICGAPTLAKDFSAVAGRLSALEPQPAYNDRATRHIAWLRDQIAVQIEDERYPPRDAELPIDNLMSEVRQALETSVEKAYEFLSYRDARETFVSRLYKDVSQSWIGRMVSSTAPPVACDSFLSTAATALDSYRHQPRVLDLVRIGYACRLLNARGSDRIDDAFNGYESLLAFCVLTGQWQAFIDQLCAAGHNVFLKKFGFDREVTRLEELASYFETVLGITVTEAQLRDSSSRLNNALFGTETLTADVRFAVDVIQSRWRNDSVPTTAEGDTTIGQWANSYALPARRSSFKPESADPLVQSFFRDCEIVIKTESRMANPEGVDESPVWTGLAWCALHLSRVMRKVQGTGDKVRTVDNMTDQDWLASGIRWAEKGMDLAEEQGRSAGVYRAVDVRKRLEQLRNKKKDVQLIEELTDRMLAIDEVRLNTTEWPSRRNRAVVRTERSICEVMGQWWRSFPTAVGLRTDSRLRNRFSLVQRLKSFNYGQLTNEPAERAAEELPVGSLADEVVDYSITPDVFDRVEVAHDDILDDEQTRRLYQHLRDTNGAILDFITHPGSGSTDWEKAAFNGWGTICFVIKAGQDDLMIKPFFLAVPEALIRLVIDGAEDQDTAHDQGGLQTDLVYWPENGDGPFPTLLQELSDRLFPHYLLNEIRGCRTLYLCPHRHLFQIPLHAFPLQRPLFRDFDTSYALKTSHIMGLTSKSVQTAAPARRWTVVDEASMGDSLRWFTNWVAPENEWGRAGLGIEDFLEAGARASQAVVCCHGQLDDARPGRARLRLWGGGRLVADDIHRVAKVSESGVDLRGSDWVIAACDAGRARVAMQTAPGLALSLVTCGAARVTSCLYRVRREVAARFVSNFVKACDRGSGAPFAAGVRGLGRDGGRADWARAASFVSYGLVQASSADQVRPT